MPNLGREYGLIHTSQGVKQAKHAVFLYKYLSIYTHNIYLHILYTYRNIYMVSD